MPRWWRNSALKSDNFVSLASQNWEFVVAKTQHKNMPNRNLVSSVFTLHFCLNFTFTVCCLSLQAFSVSAVISVELFHNTKIQTRNFKMSALQC